MAGEGFETRLDKTSRHAENVFSSNRRATSKGGWRDTLLCRCVFPSFDLIILLFKSDSHVPHLPVSLMSVYPSSHLVHPFPVMRLKANFTKATGHHVCAGTDHTSTATDLYISHITHG